MSSSFRIISIGTLAVHPLWEETSPVRTGHTTTTLIEAGDSKIIVDPGLPPAALAARLSERCRVSADEVTHVFLTAFTPEHDRGLELFENAEWLLHEPGLEAAGAVLAHQQEHAEDADDFDMMQRIEQRLERLRRLRSVEDSITLGVDLFPLDGTTPGACGLLLPLPSRTVVIAGDAVATAEHLEQAKVLPTCTDVEAAMDSFREVIEIADVIIPGRDNVLTNPTRSTF